MTDSHATHETALRDGWTLDPDYRRCYQTKDDLESVLRLLVLERASSLVDIGCGNGAFAIAAAQRYPACRVWAFDALETAVAECKAQAGGVPNLNVGVAWASAIPLDSSTAERVLFRSVLHHIAQPQAVYAEFSRLLKPGGRLVLQAPCNYWEPALGQVLSEMMLLADDSHRRFYYQPAEVVEGLRRVGFCTQEPECWTYSFPFVEDNQAEFLRQRQAEKTLRLRPLEPGKWTIESYWVRIIAEKRTP